MKSVSALAATALAFASLPMWAQQPSSGNPTSSPTTQQATPSAQTMPQASAMSAQTAPVQMNPVKGELVSKLDSKTAKSGDSVVVQTKDSVKVSDGTEIPKGSKLMGHVIEAKASGGSENSQVAIQFDHVEIKGGQSLAVQSQIQSIAPSGAMPAASSPSMAAPSAPTAPTAGNSGMNSRAGAMPPTSSSDSAAARLAVRGRPLGLS